MPVLEVSDRQSACWMRLKMHLEQRRQRLLEKLAGNLDTEKTWTVRGQIEELNATLRLGEDQPVPNESPVDYEKY